MAVDTSRYGVTGMAPVDFRRIMKRAYKLIMLLLIGVELATNPTNAFACGEPVAAPQASRYGVGSLHNGPWCGSSRLSTIACTSA